jgi:hypothetical protein
VIQTTCPLFESTREFHFWEASCELRACYDEVTTLIGRKDQFSSLLLGNLIEKLPTPSSQVDLLSAVGIVQFNKLSDLCERFLHSVSCFDSQDSSLMVSTRVNTQGGDDDVVDLTESGDESLDPAASLLTGETEKKSRIEPFSLTSHLMRAYTTLCSDQLSLGGKAKTKVSSDSIPVLSLLSIMTLGAAVCFQSYLRQAQHSTSAVRSSRPSFMSELNAGKALKRCDTSRFQGLFSRPCVGMVWTC